MPFSRPSLPQILARVKTDIQGSLAGVAAFFKRSFERGAGNAVAGASHQLHGHIDWVARQMDPSKADEDQLERIHAGPIGMSKKPAVKVRMQCTATGTNGTIVALTQVFTRADGPRYKVDVAGTVSGGTVTFEIIADVAGALANCPNTTPLLLGSPITGLNDDAVVTATLVDGADIESKDELLQRYLTARRTPVRGGAPGDYVTWTLQVAGVTRAWEYPRKEGVGTVTIFGVNDQTWPSIALSAPKIAEIVTWLDAPGRQPTQADALVYTPTLQPINFTIAVSPDTTDVRAQVVIELDEHLKRVGHPGGAVVLFSELNEAISIAPGETDHTLTNPSGNVAVPFGSMPTRGTVTWV